MRKLIAALVLALLAASPAHATAGLQCRPVSGSGPVLEIVIGHGAGPAVTGVTLREHKRLLSIPRRAGGDPLVVQQSWIDRQRLWLDLVDAQAMRYEAKLRATFGTGRRASTATGTLVRGGKTYKVRCSEA